MIDNPVPPTPILQVKGLSKRFGSNEVLKDINLSIEEGKVVAIIGPSGCGKSTLLRTINMVEKPTSGTVIINGVQINTLKGKALYQARSRIGFVFQQFNLFSHLRVYENIILSPMKTNGMSREDATELARRLLERVGLSNKFNEWPDKLSGGEQQRVAIVRALAMQPSIMLFDEPTSALDPEMVNEVLSVIRELAAKNMTMMIVTHEMKFAHDVADQIVFMDDGRIVEVGDPDTILSSPKEMRTKKFIERIVY